MTKEEKFWLRESLKTIINLCNLANLAIDHNREELVPTALENMFLEAQEVMANYCVKEE